MLSQSSKLFYTIGEVAEKCQVKPHVLRYWESEFKELKPQKNESGQRVYRRADLETALEIKRLLHEDMYTISGARNKLRSRSASPLTKTILDPKELKKQLNFLITILES